MTISTYNQLPSWFRAMLNQLGNDATAWAGATDYTTALSLMSDHLKTLWTVAIANPSDWYTSGSSTGSSASIPSYFMDLAKAMGNSWAAWSPADLGADIISFWDTWDASRYTLNSGNYSALADGKGVLDLVQSTSTKQPFLNAGDWNGQATARFDRATSEIMLTGQHPDTPNGPYDKLTSYGVFLTMGMWASDISKYVFSFYSGNDRIEMYVLNATTLRVQLVAGGVNNNTDLTIATGTEFSLFAQVRPDGTKNIWHNGVEILDFSSGTTPTGLATHSNTSIGGRFNDSIWSYSEFAHIGLTKELTDDQINDYFAWSLDKFGV